MPRYSDDEILAAYEQAGTKAGAARLLDMDERGYKRRFKRINKPKEYQAPDGYYVKGVSTLQDAEGNVKVRWVKTDLDKERALELMREVVSAMASEIQPERAVTRSISDTRADLLNCYILTDYHLGMYAWGEETGADWDIQIAEDLLVDWFAIAIEQAPPAKVGIFAQLGDFLHWDGMDAVTPTSNHLLDADTRFQLVVRVAIRVVRRIIRMLLDKHERVHVIMGEGNHDPASSVWLRELMHSLYAEESRVTVDTSVDPYYCYEHGKTSLFFHHGHKRKPKNVDHVFASKFREVFGRTQFSYAHLGHLHNNTSEETNLMEVEQHRTLASPDAYAVRGGWGSGREAKVITYHAEYGQTGRITISPDMVRDAKDA